MWLILLKLCLGTPIKRSLTIQAPIMVCGGCFFLFFFWVANAFNFLLQNSQLVWSIPLERIDIKTDFHFYYPLSAASQSRSFRKLYFFIQIDKQCCLVKFRENQQNIFVSRKKVHHFGIYFSFYFISCEPVLWYWCE